ncbi:MAG: SpoIIE family protein phosphatase [Flavobacteriales bacterium]|nr:SpoIIE family protein phosphatase [Flavobacteriales bacterium]
MSQDSILNLAAQNLYSDASYADSLCRLYLARADYSSDFSGIAKAHKFLGAIAWNHDDLKTALTHFTYENEYALKSENEAEILSSVNNLGLMYIELGSFNLALDYLFQAHNYNDGRRNRGVHSSICNNIGLAYERMGNEAQAIKYYEKSFALIDSLKEPQAMAITLNNVGWQHFQLGNLDKAERFLNESIQYGKKSKSDYALKLALSNLASIYEMTERTEDARLTWEEVLERSLAVGDIEMITRSEFTLAKLDYSKGINKNQNLNLMLSSLDKMDSINNYMGIKDLTLMLAEIYEGENNYGKANDYYKWHWEIRDSIYNIEQSRILTEMEIINDVDRKKKEIENLLQKSEKQGEQLDSATNFNKILIIIAICILFFFIFSYINYKQKKKANRILAGKNEIIQKRNQEVADSITYAKRIQSAILPPVSSFKKEFENSFILYQPKDIVSGDFYWMAREGDYTFISVADCTGHGVPGAMVSVICSNALEKVVHEFGLTDPAEILERVREVVIERFKKGDASVKDGMDIAFCAISDNKLMYAGAHNPLWIYRDNDLMEIKADKQPIGNFDRATHFTSHEVELKKGDRLYLFSDGFSDQFGGPDGKKMKIKRFKQLIAETLSANMEEQGQELLKAFTHWKGDFDQLDDVCVMGVKF